MVLPATNNHSQALDKRAALYTLGCRLNQTETRLIEDQLRVAGYRIVPFGEPAELGVIHTCVVTREAEAKSRKIIRRFIRANPGAITAVIGCFAQTDAAALADIPGVTLVLGNEAKMCLAEHLDAVTDTGPVVAHAPLGNNSFTVPFISNGPPLTRRANLKIQDGCDCMCAYCYVPFARGRSRSRRLSDVFEEASSLVRRGARELVLTGVNIGDFRDGAYGLTALVDQLDTLCPKPRIRLSSIELSNMPVELLERMASRAHGLVPHLHMPLQSGSARVLRAMGRPYAPEEYLDFMRHAATSVPGIGLGADVMVGFPGEGDDDFQATCALIQQCPLFYLHVFQFSERPGVAATRLPNKVAAQTMHERSAILLAINRVKMLEFQNQWIGCSVDVLFESLKRGCWRGHAGNYLEIAVETEENLQNAIASVRVERLRDGMLFGAIENTQPH